MVKLHRYITAKAQKHGMQSTNDMRLKMIDAEPGENFYQFVERAKRKIQSNIGTRYSRFLVTATRMTAQLSTS